MQTALFLAPEAPYPPTGGGALRSASILEYLAGRYSVDVILFREHGAPDPAAQLPAGVAGRVLVLDLPRHSPRIPAKFARTAWRLLRGAPPLVDRFSGFESAVGEFLRGRSYRVAVIEHLWCAPYWQQVSSHTSNVVLDLHNIESALMAGRAAVSPFPASFVFRSFARASLAVERRWLPRASRVLVASGPDAARVAGISPRAAVVTYPNALPQVPLPAVEEDHAIAFSGNFEYDPNADAVKYFARRVWPDLRERWPNLVWRLIGRKPELTGQGGDPRVELIDSPGDAIRTLASAAVVVVPLRAGSGTRVKILEAWAAGRAVVSTSLGAEGLPAKDGENILLADQPPRLIATVSQLLQSADLRRRLGNAGRRLYEEEFTWEAAWARLRDLGI